MAIIYLILNAQRKSILIGNPAAINNSTAKMINMVSTLKHHTLANRPFWKENAAIQTEV